MEEFKKWKKQWTWWSGDLGINAIKRTELGLSPTPRISLDEMLDIAFHQGQVEQLKEDILIVTVDINSVKYEDREPILEALQDKLKSLESKH